MCNLSIIIPILNAEHYLERCVNSCLSQGLNQDEFEIILCNDGSTDRSLEIANQLQNLHNNIVVLTQANAGAGMARNLGLRHAQGQYVMFVDSDDYLKPLSVKNPLELSLRNELDVCRFVIENKLIKNGQTWASTPIKSRILFQGKALLSCRDVPLDSACSALYRLSFLKENNIEFSKLSTAEDVEFTLHVYVLAERVMFDETKVYVYEIKDNTRGHPKKVFDIINFIKNDLAIAKTIKSLANEDHIPEETHNALIMRSNSTTASCIISLWRLRNNISRSDVKSTINYAKNLGIYPISGRTLSWKTTVLAYLFLNNEKLILRFLKILTH